MILTQYSIGYRKRSGSPISCGWMSAMDLSWCCWCRPWYVDRKICWACRSQQKTQDMNVTLSEAVQVRLIFSNSCKRLSSKGLCGANEYKGNVAIGTSGNSNCSAYVSSPLVATRRIQRRSLGFPYTARLSDSGERRRNYLVKGPWAKMIAE